MKIAVIGYSGSGKSTFAAQISKECDIPLLHLDTVYYTEGWGVRDTDERTEIINNFMSENDSWVIDGNYSKLLMSQRMESRDKIIFFNFPRYISLYRAVKRYLTYKGRTRPSMAEGCEEKLDFEFIKWILFDGRSKEKKASYDRIANQYPQKFVRVKNDKQVKKLKQILAKRK